MDVPDHFGVAWADTLRRFAEDLMAAAGEDGSELGVSLVTDGDILELNRIHRGRGEATDVLSFALREGEPVGSASVLGDIVISLDTARRQAPGFGNTPMEETLELLFHGFLHLLGYDHEGDGAGAWKRAEASLIDALKTRNAPHIPGGMVFPAERDGASGAENEGRTN